MDYIKKVLGLKTNYLNHDTKQYPNFINTRYQLRKVSLDNQKNDFSLSKSGD